MVLAGLRIVAAKKKQQRKQALTRFSAALSAESRVSRESPVNLHETILQNLFISI